MLIFGPFNRIVIFDRGIFFYLMILFSPLFLINLLINFTRFIFKNETLLILLLILLLFISFLLSSIQFNLSTDLNYFKPVIFSFALFIHNSPKNKNFFYAVFYIIGFLTLISFLFLNDFYFRGDRLSIIFNDGTTVLDPNVISFTLIPSLLLTMLFFKKFNFFYKLLSIIYFLLSVYFILLTGSRSVMFSLIVGIIVYYYLNRKLILYIPFLIITFLVFILISPTSLFPSIERFNLFNIINTNGSGRLLIWEDTLFYFFNNNFINLFIGNGYSSTITIIGFNSHNLFLEFLFEYGLIATFIIILIIIKLFSKFYKTNDYFSFLLLTSTIFWGLFISVNYELVFIIMVYYFINTYLENM